MGQIRLDSVTKIYPGDVKAVDRIDLEIRDGEFMVLVGPSGCGKSTLLRMIAGLEEITEGRMFIGDEDVTRLRPRDRDIAMVFQDYALYPQMTVDENVGFGLKLRHVRKPERTTRVHAVAQTLGLNTLLDRKPAFLSGGQRQRVAMGRAIAREPKAFLMDEPLSNLDAKLRVSMRAELARLHARLRVTTIYVTHDQVEAMTLGQRVAVLRDGVLQQCDTPQHLFHHPVNLFVASFIGSPSMNLVEATIADGHVAFAGLALPLPARCAKVPQDRKIILGIRPTDIRHTEDAPPDQPRITVRPDVIEELGGVSNLLFPLDAPRVVPDGAALSEPAADDQGTLLADDQRARFCATIDGRRQVALGDEVQVAIDHRHLQYFDRETGVAIAGGPASTPEPMTTK
jgi:multiple sugar transport system ATP-binding protein